MRLEGGGARYPHVMGVGGAAIAMSVCGQDEIPIRREGRRCAAVAPAEDDAGDARLL